MKRKKKRHGTVLPVSAGEKGVPRHLKKGKVKEVFGEDGG